MFRSVTAVLLGVFVTLVVETLIVGGILGPLFQALLPLNTVNSPVLTVLILVVPVVFAFYFGGMAAGYRATSRHELHGLIVVLTLVVVSPALNLLALNSQNDQLPQIRAAQTILILVVATISAFVGARRGKGFYAYNQAHIRRQRARKG